MPQAAPTPPPAPAAPPAGRRQRPALPGVLFDSDMGESADSALALALLYGASSKVKVIGVTVTTPNLDAASFCDVVGRFYASGGRLKVSPPHYYAPVGFNAGAGGRASLPMLSKVLALTAPDGSLTYRNEITSVLDTAEVGVVFRNALLTQKDGEGIVVTAGPLTNLVRAMALPGNKELIAARVGLLVVAAGSFGDSPDDKIDPRIKTDIASARKALAEWPGQIVFVGREAGLAVPYPGTSIAKDFEWAPSHPVAEAYKAFRPMPYDAPSQAVLAALYAVSSNDDLLSLSEAGNVEIRDDGRTVFTPSANGKHRRLLTQADVAWKGSVTEAFTKLAGNKPVPVGRGGFSPQSRQNQAGPAGVPPGPPAPPQK